MKRIINFLPMHVSTLIKRLAIVVLLLFVTRLIFLAFNYGSFQNLSIWDYGIAIWFDMITVGLLFLPYYLLFLLPIPIRGYKLHRAISKIFFHLSSTLLLALNLMDVEYFKYTTKRSTFDLFTVLGAGDDFGQLLTSFLRDSWHLILFLIILVLFSEFLYRKTQVSFSTFQSKPKNFYRSNMLAFLICLPILIIIGRGGFALKPTGIIEAARYSRVENTAFILTTPFTMIKTIDQGSLEEVDFFSDNECLKHFNPIRRSSPQNIFPDSTNVVIIMLESFGNEFVGPNRAQGGYTPFFDSLTQQSLSFKYGFANGKKSIEAVPAVVASIPTLMDNPYISSPYGDNRINSLPSILSKHGYSSAFYHGATNGSMRFDGFSEIVGFNEYFGRFEYNNDEHFDKTWGILDEHFNPWTARKMTELNEPFLGMLFTLSSHHPYFIPPHIKNKIKKGPQPICGSINYGDYALKLFFEEAKKQPWYDNTLFVILADHTPASKTPLYNVRTHIFGIPIVFYHPNGKLKPEKSNEIFQQLDILPTILDLLNIKTDYYAFGNSHYDNTEKEAITYLEGTYYYFRNGFMTSFINERARNLYDYKVQNIKPIDSISFYKDEVEKYELRIKAMIQTYNRDLIMNQTIVNEK